MIGAELSKKVHGKVTEKENLKITTIKGCYHDIKLSKPNIVIGKYEIHEAEAQTKIY